MGKYDPLAKHLRRQKTAEYEMSFADVERVIGALLPKSATRPQWWANVADPDTTHVQREAWRAAGFEAFLLTGRDRVKFRRVGTA